MSSSLLYPCGAMRIPPPRRAHDAPGVELLPQRGGVVPVQPEGQHPRPAAGAAVAQHVGSHVGQPGDGAVIDHSSVGQGFDARVEEQVDRGAHLQDRLEERLRPSLEPPGAVVVDEFEVVPFLAIRDRRPSGSRGRSRSRTRSATKKTPVPSGPSNHLWASAAAKSTPHSPTRGGQHAEPLDRIDTEQHAVVVAEGRQAGEIGPPPPPELHPTHDHQRCRLPFEFAGEELERQGPAVAHRLDQIDLHLEPRRDSNG